MSIHAEQGEPIPGMDGVFRFSRSNELQDKLKTGPIPMDAVTRLLSRAYYEVHGIGSDFVTPPEFFPQIGRCHARFALLAYEQLGKPQTFSVFEAGGGNGTLIRGFLAEASRHPEFFQALTYHMIEQSDGLIEWQKNHLDPEVSQKVLWHHDDITQFVFPQTEVGMYLVMENDDDLPSKAIHKQDGMPEEIYLALKQGSIVEQLTPASPEFLDFITQYSDWWAMIPENISIALPMHMESVRVRERFIESTQRGLLLTTDYGYHLDQSTHDMQFWNFPLYRGYENNRKLFFRESPFANVLNRYGQTNYTADVDFFLLSEPGKRAGYSTINTTQCEFLETFGIREIVEDVARARYAAHGMEVSEYLRKLAFVTDPGIDWKTQIQWKGFTLPPIQTSQDTATWLYELGARYQCGDIRPLYRRGVLR